MAAGAENGKLLRGGFIEYIEQYLTQTGAGFPFRGNTCKEGSKAVSEEISKEVSMEISKEVSKELSTEVSKEISTEVSKELIMKIY